MSYRKFGMACFLGAAVLASDMVYADENDQANKDWHVTVSGKLWANSWNGWTSAGNNGTNSVVASNTPFIGGVTARYKDFFVSGNYSPSTNYDFSSFTGQGTYSRKEMDLNVGYYLVPQVALAAGYKEVDMTYSAFSTWKYKFAIVGINGVSRINDTRAFMYGNGGFGVGTVSSTYAPFAGYGAGNPTYESIEAGFGYSITNNLVGTIGYKYQQISLSFANWAAKARDITTGYMFGLAYTF